MLRWLASYAQLLQACGTYLRFSDIQPALIQTRFARLTALGLQHGIQLVGYVRNIRHDYSRLKRDVA